MFHGKHRRFFFGGRLRPEFHGGAGGTSASGTTDKEVEMVVGGVPFADIEWRP